MWCVPKIDEAYERALVDVVSIYEKPLHDRLPVVCLDEKSVELRKDTRPEKIASNGLRLKDYEYERCGTANVFVMTEPKGGKHFCRVTERRTATDFAETLEFLSRQYVNAITIHLVVDNLNTHAERSLIRRYGEYEGRKLWARFTVHYTPKHASWLNQAEITIGLFTRCCLKNQRIGSIETLDQIAHTFFSKRTEQKFTIHWKWTQQRAIDWVRNYWIEH